MSAPPAFIGAYLFPVILASSLAIRGAEAIAAGMSLVGLILTLTLLPEPKGHSLEELTKIAYARDLPAGAPA